MKRNATSAASVLIVSALVTLAGSSVKASLRIQSDPSVALARTLQNKIDAIKAAEEKKGRSSETVTVTEAELQSYVLYEMRDEIPARVDALDVRLSDGAVSADTQLTFASDSTGNAVLDTLVSGTHSLFLKGKLAAVGERGRFELQEVRLDGIPVPTILIETLVERYVKPTYPYVDLNQEFQMPWGIDAITLTNGKATIRY